MKPRTVPHDAAPPQALTDLYRPAAIAAKARDRDREADVLRFDARWPRVAAGLVIAAGFVAFQFISLFGVDEYATGPAVVRVEGRSMITTPAASVVESVEVRAGQWVESGVVLARLRATEENSELARANTELDLQVIRMLRDPSDTAAKQALTMLRTDRDQAKNRLDARNIRATIAGYVTDVRVRPGQRVEAGDVVMAVVPKDADQLSVMAMVPADDRPLLHPGQTMRFELDGFRYEYADLVVTEVSGEAVGTTEVRRFLGADRTDLVALDPGAKVFVTARLAASTFMHDGMSYGYVDGLTGTSSIRMRREPILLTLVPALRDLFH